MRILISLTYYHPYVSGLTATARLVAEDLVRRGHAVSVLCMRHQTGLPRTETVNGVRVIRARPFVRLSKGFLSWEWLWLTLKQVSRHDAILLHLPQFEGLAPALVGRLAGKRVVVMYHCDILLPPGLGRYLIQTVLNWSTRFSLRLAAVVLHTTKDYASHSPFLQDVMAKVRYTGPVVKPFSPPALPPPEPGEFRIGFVGRLAADKGVEYLIQTIPFLASALAAPFKLVLVGPRHPVGERAYRHRIEGLVKRYRAHIHWLGPLSDTGLAALLPTLHVLVLPSVNATESFGLVQVEAMMSGVPVVASALPGVRVPIQTTGMGVLVPPGDSAALAQGIAKVLRHADRYRRASQDPRTAFPASVAFQVYAAALGVVR